MPDCALQRLRRRALRASLRLGFVAALGCWTAGGESAAQTNYLDNETLYRNQDPNTETRRSAHFRICFGHFNRDTGAPMTEQLNTVWTNANASQRANEFILDRMFRCDSSGSPDKAGALKDLWGDMAKKMVSWDFERQRWLAQANSADHGSDCYFYQRNRTPLVTMPCTSGWYRPARSHAPMAPW